MEKKPLPSPAPTNAYTASPVPGPDGGTADVRIERDGRTQHLAGRGGAAAERDRALAALSGGGLPVFVGAGLGAGIRAAREATGGPVFVLDKETAIDAATGLRASLADDPDVRFLDDADPQAAASNVADAARQAGFARLALVVHPLYRRLDPEWYGAAIARLAAYETFRQGVGYPKFASGAPRVLVLWRPYFLYREIESALNRLGVARQRVAMSVGETGETGVVAALLAAVAAFRPDFAITVNHLGLDREGRLAGLLNDIGLPLASWFVDSPRLILHDFAAVATPTSMIFSYDADALADVTALGFAHAAWLPLGTDPTLFVPLADRDAAHPWRADVSFVGASMVPQAREALDKLAGFPQLAKALPEAAAGFAASPERSASRFLSAHPVCGPAYAALPRAEDRLAAELALTWEATRRYRHACVRAILPFAPAIAGDSDWETALPRPGRDWRRLPPLDYYDNLPDFYPRSRVNLNCTSLQMKGAVNQRVFDVPACGGFVLTDAREQFADLFDVGREAAVYPEPAAIPDMTRHYLAHPAERERIATAGRRRVLAEHTYDRRLESLLAAMRATFGG